MTGVVRPDIKNRTLLILVGGMVLSIVGYFLLQPLLPISFRTPGSPVLYVFGVVGTLFLLCPAVFSGVKRAGLGGSPPRWFVIHVVSSCIGTALIAVHSGGNLGRPPVVMILLLAGLIVFGVWARVHLSKTISSTFGAKHQNFGHHAMDHRAALGRLIERKTAVLARLDPQVSEATFSVTLRHWLKSPFLSRRYVQLAGEEARIISTRQAVHPRQAYWRLAHMIMAWMFIGGIGIHVITVTFFAGYVADGGPVHWWHLKAWGGGQ